MNVNERLALSFPKSVESGGMTYYSKLYGGEKSRAPINAREKALALEGLNLLPSSLLH